MSLPDAVMPLVQQKSPVVDDGEWAGVCHGKLLLDLCAVGDAAKVQHMAGEVQVGKVYLSFQSHSVPLRMPTVAHLQHFLSHTAH